MDAQSKFNFLGLKYISSAKEKNIYQNTVGISKTVVAWDCGSKVSAVNQ